LRRDGSPRVSGLEQLFGGGELWLSMMPGSRKATDLLADPRFALHSAGIDKDVVEGDAKLSGRAVHVPEEIEAFTALLHEVGAPYVPTELTLFRADVRDVSFLIPAGDHLVIESWREGGEVQRVERR